MPNDEDNSHERPAVSPRLTAGAQAVRVKPLVWVETFEDRGDGLSEHNGGYESASVLGFYEIGMGFGSDAYYWSVCDPNYNEIGSFEDPSYAKSAAQADYEARILAALDVSETPESERQTYLLSANERQEVRDKALDDAAQAASNRAAYWWDEATAANDAGRKEISLIYEAKTLACAELAAAIRVMKEPTMTNPITTPAQMRKARIERLFSDLEYEIVRGVMEREIEPDLHLCKVFPCIGRGDGLAALELHVYPAKRNDCPSWPRSGPKLRVMEGDKNA